MPKILDIEKLKNNQYKLTTEDSEYTLDEDVIVKYYLFKGQEVDDKHFNKALVYNDMMTYYNMALDYAIKYDKNAFEVKKYLFKKKVDMEVSDEIVRLLVERKIIVESRIIQNRINHMVSNCYGMVMIEHKLCEMRFDIDLIDEALNKFDYGEYDKSLRKYANKMLKKYKDLDARKKYWSLKSDLYRRGYTSDDLDEISDIIDEQFRQMGEE